ncbi:MAG TPA: multidrug efflux SMR transporter [Mycobacteriales bacterium]
MAWVLLMGAIVSEVAATVALRASNGFTRLAPLIVVGVGYGLSFFLMSLTLKRIALSTTYAVWSGVGTALVAMVGVFFLGESMNTTKMVGLVLVVGGVMLLNVAGASR